MSVLRRRWKAVALVTAFAVLGTVAGLLTAGREYLATTTLRVPAAGPGAGGTNLDYVDRLTNTYERIAQSPSLRAEMQRRLPGEQDVAVSVEPLPNTELMHLTARADDPRTAQAAANRWAMALVQRVEASRAEARSGAREEIDEQLGVVERRLTELREVREATADPGRRAALDQSIRVGELRYEALAQQAAGLDVTEAGRGSLSIAEPAVVDAGGWPGAVRRLGLGLVLGLVAGTGVAFLLERRAPQLDTLDEIERAAGSPVLATVPLLPSEGTMVFNGGSPAQDAFGSLRARLLARDSGQAPRTILVASAHEGDGKSLVAVNLAAALARARRRVLLIDGDLRRPSLHPILGVRNSFGLTDLLQPGSGAPEPKSPGVTPTHIGNLDMLPSGSDSLAAAELLASPRMTELVAGFKRRYEFVVVDSPGLLDRGDAAALAAQVDVVVLVVNGTPVSHEVVEAVRRQLEALGADRIGVVVNRWTGDRLADFSRRRRG
jgi:capsular exopolysaccharide synthesis family protein